jgi:soluble lytic murein transglycosylase-like protein
MRRSLLRLAALALLVICVPIYAQPETPEVPSEELRNLLLNAVKKSASFSDRYEAEVWLLDMSERLRPRLDDPEERLEILRQVHSEAKLADLKPELVLAVIDVESRFDRFAVSVAGARGLMQVMPFWLKEIGRPDDNLFDINTNLRMGCTILRYYLDMEKGDLTKALARYNGSTGRFRYPILVFNAMSKRWF